MSWAMGVIFIKNLFKKLKTFPLKACKKIEINVIDNSQYTENNSSGLQGDCGD